MTGFAHQSHFTHRFKLLTLTLTSLSADVGIFGFLLGSLFLCKGLCSAIDPVMPLDRSENICLGRDDRLDVTLR